MAVSGLMVLALLTQLRNHALSVVAQRNIGRLEGLSNQQSDLSNKQEHLHKNTRQIVNELGDIQNNFWVIGAMPKDVLSAFRKHYVLAKRPYYEVLSPSSDLEQIERSIRYALSQLLEVVITADRSSKADGYAANIMIYRRISEVGQGEKMICRRTCYSCAKRRISMVLKRYWNFVKNYPLLPAEAVLASLIQIYRILLSKYLRKLIAVVCCLERPRLFSIPNLASRVMPTLPN